MLDNVTSRLDLTDAQWFLDMLGGPGAQWTFQTFDDSKRKAATLARVFHGRLADHADKLWDLNANHNAGIFACVNETDGKGRKAKNVTKVRAIFADLDGSDRDEALAKLKAIGLEPHIIIQTSPGRWHLYMLADGIPLDQFKPIQRRLIKLLGSDASVHDLPRVMRLPDFVNQKDGPYEIEACDWDLKPGDLARAEITIEPSREPPKGRRFLVWLYEVSDHARYGIEAFDGLPAIEDKPKERSEPKTKTNGHHYPPADEQRLFSAIDHIPNDSQWGTWSDVGMAIHRTTSGSDAGFRAFVRFSAKSGKFDAANCKERWGHWDKHGADELNAGSIFYWAKQAGWVDPSKPEDPPPPTEEPDNDPAAGSTAQSTRPGGASAGTAPGAAPSPLSPPGSEDALALELVDEHGHELRYVAQFGQWFHWDGQHWAEDRTVAIYDRARAIARAEANATNKDGLRRKLASAATVSGIERLARSDRRIAMTIEQFDADPVILNTPGGIVDLRTGLLRPCDPAALCSQITAVAPADHDDCPIWKAALSLYMKHDSEMVAFLQRLAGYFLWGALVDQIIGFAHGGGGNGKGTYFNTAMRIMGSYAKAAPSEVFLISPFDRHPTELARLHNARLVVSSEIDKGRRWNMTRLNEMSGGDAVTAHFMRQDDFTYLPKFKIALHANNKPSFGKVDEAVRRRLRLLAFLHTVSDQDRAANPNFDDQIKAEWPAILRWMINGCLDWQREGLNPPQKVIDASADYLDSQNNIAAWMVDGCVEDTTARTTLKDLFESWTSWCKTHNETPGTSRALADALEELGFPRIRMAKGTRGHAGLRRVIA